MKSIIVAILFTITMYAQTDTAKSSLISVTGTKNFYVYQKPQLHSIIFNDDSANFSITWKDGNVEILYGKKTKPSEAVKQFFNLLKKYIKQDYYIVRKEDVIRLELKNK